MLAIFELAQKEKTERNRDKIRNFVSRRSTTTRYLNTLVKLRKEMICYNFKDEALALAIENKIRKIRARNI